MRLEALLATAVLAAPVHSQHVDSVAGLMWDAKRTSCTSDTPDVMRRFSSFQEQTIHEEFTEGLKGVDDSGYGTKLRYGRVFQDYVVALRGTYVDGRFEDFVFGIRFPDQAAIELHGLFSDGYAPVDRLWYHAGPCHQRIQEELPLRLMRQYAHSLVGDVQEILQK